MFLFFFFFNDTATTEIYTLSLHDALPILLCPLSDWRIALTCLAFTVSVMAAPLPPRSEEHTSELQSQSNLVCRLLLEKKKKICITVSSYITVHAYACRVSHRLDMYHVLT